MPNNKFSYIPLEGVPVVQVTEQMISTTNPRYDVCGGANANAIANGLVCTLFCGKGPIKDSQHHQGGRETWVSAGNQKKRQHEGARPAG